MTVKVSVTPLFSVNEVLFNEIPVNGTFTVTLQLAVLLPTFAVMVVVPLFTAVIFPF